MTIEDLIKKLQERPKSVDEHREEQLAEWKRALGTLVDQIEAWLRPAVEKGVLSVSRSETEIEEEDFGSYAAPVLRVMDGRATARFEPIAGRIVGVVGAGDRRLIGLKGRVDLVCGPIRIPIVRTNSGTWKAVPLSGESRELTADVVAELIASALLDE